MICDESKASGAARTLDSASSPREREIAAACDATSCTTTQTDNAGMGNMKRNMYKYKQIK